tara:strand:+ start:117 stop:218 length:102 start_codon:yes stop_codon:yes gene_type:complete
MWIEPGWATFIAIIIAILMVLAGIGVGAIIHSI